MQSTELLPARSTNFKETEKSAKSQTSSFLMHLLNSNRIRHCWWPVYQSLSTNHVSRKEVWISIKIPFHITDVYTHRILVASIKHMSQFSGKVLNLKNACCWVYQHDSSDVQMGSTRTKVGGGTRQNIRLHLLFFPCGGFFLVLDKIRKHMFVWPSPAAISKPNL